MKPEQRTARAANTANLSLEQGAQQLGLRYGVVVGRSGSDRSVDVQTAEGAVVKNLVPVYPTELVDYPPPSVGSVVVWAFADGLAEQPFYLGVVRPPTWEPKQDGEFRLTGSLIKLDAATKTLINEAPVAVLGSVDSDGDTIIEDNQPPQQA